MDIFGYIFQIRFHFESAKWIPEGPKERFRELYGHKLTKQGEVVITAEEHRTQEDNRKSCLVKLQAMLEEACFIPKERIPTEKPKWANERRLEDRRKRSEVKNLRRRNFSDWG